MVLGCGGWVPEGIHGIGSGAASYSSSSNISVTAGEIAGLSPGSASFSAAVLQGVPEYAFNYCAGGSCPTGGYGGSTSGAVTGVTPVITGIAPSDWNAGATTTVTLTGQYFGTNTPTLTFNPASGITYALSSQNDTQIVASVTVSSSTPTETAAVTVSNGGYSGQQFQGGVGQSATSTPANAQVTVARPVTISITSNGFAITTAQCNGASGTNPLISPGGANTPPTMPQLTYALQNGPSGNVTWRLEVNDGRADSSGPTDRLYPAATAPGPGSSQDWGTSGNIGGNATITASYAGGSTSASFCILGANPVVANVVSFLQNQPGYFWAVPFLVSQESSTQQFNYNNNSITPYGFPLSDGPTGWGYGVMQLSNGTGTTDQLWNWQSNVVKGMQLLLSLEGLGDTFWTAQLSTSANSTIQIGNDIESQCTFTPIAGRTPSGAPHSYADAIILKRYNSAAANHDYVGYNVAVDAQNSLKPPQIGISPINVWTQPTIGSPDWTAQAPPQPNVWYVQQLAGNLTNYVASVCSHGN
jgi:hypothetical protein